MEAIIGLILLFFVFMFLLIATFLTVIIVNIESYVGANYIKENGLIKAAKLVLFGRK